ncbi:hypothetical protein CPB85DRAFT_416529 [Mucidula mucida]|nr:hypothetical protein CPB85DRAFT_416529 [Mucidula mucida]
MLGPSPSPDELLSLSVFPFMMTSLHMSTLSAVSSPPEMLYCLFLLHAALICTGLNVLSRERVDGFPLVNVLTCIFETFLQHASKARRRLIHLSCSLPRFSSPPYQVSRSSLSAQRPSFTLLHYLSLPLRSVPVLALARDRFTTFWWAVSRLCSRAAGLPTTQKYLPPKKGRHAHSSVYSRTPSARNVDVYYGPRPRVCRTHSCR